MAAQPRHLEAEASTAAICCSGQIVLGDLAATLARLEACTNPRPAGERRSLASRRVQAVLDVAFAASDPRGKKMREQRTARTHLPHGGRKPHMGRAAHSRGTENAWIRCFGANRAALDAESAPKSRIGKAMGGIPEQPS